MRGDLHGGKSEAANDASHSAADRRLFKALGAGTAASMLI